MVDDEHLALGAGILQAGYFGPLFTINNDGEHPAVIASAHNLRDDSLRFKCRFAETQ
jgi:hypothetical protein